MPGDVTWFPICAALTALGIVAAFLAFRRRNLVGGLRLLGWAALPMAIYLTDMITMLWKIGSAIGHWAIHFAFSFSSWIGLALFGVAFVLFGAAVLGRRLREKAAAAEPAGPPAPAGRRAAAGRATPPPRPAGRREVEPARRAPAPGGRRGADDAVEGMDEVEAILRKHGIS